MGQPKQAATADAVGNQLGASVTPKSPEDRGILSLSARSAWRSEHYPNSLLGLQDFFSRSLTGGVPDPMRVEDNKGVARSILLSVYSQSYLHAHATHVAVFQDTLRDTESPALAPQAALARIHQMAYYNYLALKRRDIPQEHRGGHSRGRYLGSQGAGNWMTGGGKLTCIKLANEKQA